MSYNAKLDLEGQWREEKHESLQVSSPVLDICNKGAIRNIGERGQLFDKESSKESFSLQQALIGLLLVVFCLL